MKSEEKRFVLGGFAGTGKTTLSKEMIRRYGSVRFCAYTGKAASVLVDKGCPATTLHSAIYTLVGEEEGEPAFDINYDSDLARARLVIVDEYSMLNHEIIKDLESIAKKVLYLGDPFQLPPVSGNCPLVPDFILSEIYRQGVDSPILRAATDIRLGKSLSKNDDGDFMFLPKNELGQSEYIVADQIIIGLNSTRVAWNRRFRQVLGKTKIFPENGDKIICLKNNHEIGIYNGMIANAQSDSIYDEINETVCLSIEDYNDIKANPNVFLGKPFNLNHHCNFFDYAYAITCHKAQGSEWDHVVIFQESNATPKWLYTAITRAKKKCVVVY